MTRGALPVGGTSDAGALVNYQAWSLADYVAHRFGRARFADLVDGVVKHSRWETLTREVLGAPVEEFERGWRAHVEKLVE